MGFKKRNLDENFANCSFFLSSKNPTIFLLFEDINKALLSFNNDKMILISILKKLKYGHFDITYDYKKNKITRINLDPGEYKRCKKMKIRFIIEMTLPELKLQALLHNIKQSKNFIPYILKHINLCSLEAYNFNENEWNSIKQIDISSLVAKDQAERKSLVSLSVDKIKELYTSQNLQFFSINPDFNPQTSLPNDLKDLFNQSSKRPEQKD